MREIAAKVSVAHNTLLIIITSANEKTWKIYWLMTIIKPVIKTKPMIVPKTPKNQIKPKLSKNKDLRKLYPAEKIIGGSIIAKNISLEN